VTEKIVLLVEDNLDDVDLTLRAFAEIEFPHKIVVARDGVEAMDVLFATGEHAGRDAENTPVVLLLDLKLPRMGGLKVLELSRAYVNLKSVIVVVLTGSADQSDVAEAASLGASLYLRKPADFDQFIDIARRVESLVSGAASHG
jgi:two-component system response regulator